jgi:hypothetical protein
VPEVGSYKRRLPRRGEASLAAAGSQAEPEGLAGFLNRQHRGKLDQATVRERNAMDEREPRSEPPKTLVRRNLSSPSAGSNIKYLMPAPTPFAGMPAFAMLT